MTEVSGSKKDVVPSAYREKYKESGGTCGDLIASELQRVAKDGIDGVVNIQFENGIERTRWADFNNGMRRMNLANVLRGRFLKGETVTILGKEYNAKDMIDSQYDTVEDNPKFLLNVAHFLGLQENDRTVKSLQALLFPKAKGPTAEERAATKAKKEADAAAAKEAKAAEKAQAKADKEAEKLKAKADKEAEKLKAKADKEAAKAQAKADAAAAKEAATTE